MCAQKSRSNTPSTNRARGIRLPEELELDIKSEAEARNRSWSAMTAELLDEAMRMRHAPGIAFADSITGRRAIIAGTGLDVWEVIAAWQMAGKKFDTLQDDFPWLSEVQLRAALAYYERYPAEIDVRLERERAWTPEQLQQTLPFVRPHD